MTNREEKNDLPFWKIPAVRQTFVICGPMALIFSAGVFMGTATVMLPQLKKDDSDIYVSEPMSAWLYIRNTWSNVFDIQRWSVHGNLNGDDATTEEG
ncbi:hypothetical protein MSG28_012670 [Choristoneura fumiferana]|uniref:Uncharacterized protein n=1 Tax=Choristoneura fumiferana TaxID=7141 RepID=A0ACC0JHE6_CHOFU|nr:hypothetical protein MSG28_012670 [Choristoneura fumiferana]